VRQVGHLQELQWRRYIL